MLSNILKLLCNKMLPTTPSTRSVGHNSGVVPEPEGDELPQLNERAPGKGLQTKQYRSRPALDQVEIATRMERNARDRAFERLREHDV